MDRRSQGDFLGGTHPDQQRHPDPSQEIYIDLGFNLQARMSVVIENKARAEQKAWLGTTP